MNKRRLKNKAIENVKSQIKPKKKGHRIADSLFKWLSIMQKIFSAVYAQIFNETLPEDIT